MSPGTVFLVGAGPGDPSLLTVRADRLLQEGDVILVDSLVSDEILDRVAASATVVDVGKRPDDGERASQAAINERLVRDAQAGRDVVRLKGGDPFVFGRGGEELEYLTAHEIPVEVVPGITSAIGVPGRTGIPLTHREHASSLTVVTGHEDPAKPTSSLDWAALTHSVVAGGTLVILMGVGRLPDNVAVLRDHGAADDTPVAMIERGTCDDEFTITARLDTIVERAREVGIESPAVTIVGDVVGIRDTVSRWLSGLTGTPACDHSCSTEVEIIQSESSD